MERGSTLVLRAVIVLIGLVVLAICTLALPRAIAAELKGDFDYSPILVGLYVTAVPFFIALYQALKLLHYIDKNEVFTYQAVRALKNIKYCAVIISGLFALGMPYVFYVADKDDAPGVAALGFVVIGASFVIGSAAALFQKLLHNAVAIKSENDLTV